MRVVGCHFCMAWSAAPLDCSPLEREVAGLPSQRSSMHVRVWRIAGPMMLSNVSVPLLGAVDTAVVGRLPDPANIGAVAVAAVIFNFLYWGCGFLRMGT